MHVEETQARVEVGDEVERIQRESRQSRRIDALMTAVSNGVSVSSAPS